VTLLFKYGLFITAHKCPLIQTPNASVTAMSEGPTALCRRVATIILLQVSEIRMFESAKKEGLLYKQNSNSHMFNCLRADWDSIVSIATHYGLDGPGIEYRWE
jgi:hypothetical protein